MASAETSRHSSPGPSEAGKPPRLEGKMFPMGVSEAASQWWMSSSPLAAERKVLSFIPHVREATEEADKSNGTAHTPDPYGIRLWRQSMVQLSGKNRALNELSIERVGETQTDTLVMLHGYGAGLAFFYKNFEPLSRIRGLKLYALDLLGMGNSTRPKFKIHAKDKQEQAIEAENWFVDALEEWRKIRNIQTFTLLAHSLGGYLAVSYALRYPGHLKKLILVSPVGIPEDPNAGIVSVLNPPETTAQQEFVQDQQTITHSDNSSEASASQGATPSMQTPSWLVCLWESKLSPFSFIRAAGPLGPKLVSGWSSRRFNHLPDQESQALHEYSFSIFKQKGSGEFALNSILTPTVHARRPVVNRIHQLGRQPIPQAGPGTPTMETGIPTVFIYGDSDWMDVAGGLAAEHKLNKLNAEILRNATHEEKLKENGSAKVIIVSKAGHHLYLDNPDEFNEIIAEELKTTKEV